LPEDEARDHARGADSQRHGLHGHRQLHGPARRAHGGRPGQRGLVPQRHPFDWSERQGGNGVLYYEAQDSGIADARKTLNKKAMDEQENITHFQEQFNGQFPFNANGILVLQPTASFEEEMQTKIVFVNGSIGGSQGTSLATFSHENMHQWWGDNVSYTDHRLTFFKEGQADSSERFYAAKIAADAAGGQGTPAGDAAFEVSLSNYFATQYNQVATQTRPLTYWTVAPSNPTSASLFGTSNTYTRPGASYLALRTILGKDNSTTNP
jgi:hypothetical protein